MPNEPQVPEGLHATPPLPQELIVEAEGLRSVIESIPSEPVELANSGSTAPPADAVGLPDFVHHVHEYIREQIHLADQKAGFVFALAGAILAYEAEKDLHQAWLSDPRNWNWLAYVSFLSMFTLFLSAILAAAVVLPRLGRSHKGNVYFGSVAEHESAEQYAVTVNRLMDNELKREILMHSHDLSKICRAKYRVLAAALWSAATGVVAGIVALLG